MSPRPFPAFPRAARALLVAALGLSLPAGCGSSGQYVWYSSLPRTEWGAPRGEYVLGAGDVLNIRVYEQDGLSGTLRIRRDGRIALPLIGEVVPVGKQPAEFAREIETRLKQFIVAPRVTVNVEQSQPITVNTLGEVKTVGTITLEPPAHMIHAMAQAGGLAEFADDERIFVLRQVPSFQRIRFTYEAILNNEGGAATFPLRTGDVIVVE